MKSKVHEHVITPVTRGYGGLCLLKWLLRQPMLLKGHVLRRSSGHWQAYNMSEELLRQENALLREEIERLKLELARRNAPERTTSTVPLPFTTNSTCVQSNGVNGRCSFVSHHNMSKEQVQRYSRHLLLPSFGVDAQQRLCESSVLIVGCGGLGSPAALYLAAAGVGRLGLVDHDAVDISNLHRQIIHTEARVGMHKAVSACMSCHALNSLIDVETHCDGFKPSNAIQIVEQYDLVLDCSDNPATRYLVSDACMASGKPLVSAAAVGTDGQLTVYGYGADGPCYRCLFPESPAPENCSRCGDAGVLGVVPGIMGTLQALEAIKILSGKGDVLSKKLLIFDALAGHFTVVKLRMKSPTCIACGSSPSITRSSLASYDYVQFTGQEATDGPPVPWKVVPPEQRVTPTQLKEAMDAASASGRQLVLIDVRPEGQYKVMNLPGTLSVPIEKLEEQLPQLLKVCMGQLHGGSSSEDSTPAGSAGESHGSQQPCNGSSHVQPNSAAGASANGVRTNGVNAGTGLHGPGHDVFVMCRRGNASQLAVKRLRELGIEHAVDVMGGYTAWAQEVDETMPIL